MTIAKRIKQARLELGISQSELARLMGVKPQSVQQWECGETQPRGKRIQKLSDALSVNKEWLVFGDELNESNADYVVTRLSKNEVKLVGNFRDLTEQQQNKVVRDVISLKKQNEKFFEELSKKKSKVRR